MKSSSIIFTSTLSENLMDWLNERAKKEGVTKRSILEKALNHYKKALKKAEFEEGFARAAKDPEMFMMAEEGWDDYLEQLNRLDA